MDNVMNQIQKTVVEILHLKLHARSDICSSSYWDTPLTGDHFQLTAIDLAYLLFELERIYEIRIDEKYFLEYKFNSVNAISDTIHDIKMDLI